jgi:hypothetical protein
MSFCLGDDRIWPNYAWYRSDKEPNIDNERKMEHGIHAFMSLAALRRGFWDLSGLLRYRDCSPPEARWDGVVRGTVVLWGVCINCARGYRAQYARPASFDEAHGERADEAIERLRRLFHV